MNVHVGFPHLYEFVVLATPAKLGGHHSIACLHIHSDHHLRVHRNIVGVGLGCVRTCVRAGVLVGVGGVRADVCWEAIGQRAARDRIGYVSAKRLHGEAERQASLTQDTWL